MVEETGDEREEEGVGLYLSQKDKEGLHLDRGETDMAHRQMAGYKGKGGNPELG